jgi:hypothetical protein
LDTGLSAQSNAAAARTSSSRQGLRREGKPSSNAPRRTPRERQIESVEELDARAVFARGGAGSFERMQFPALAMSDATVPR